MSNGKGENAERMGSFEDPSNTSQTIVGEEMIEELITEARLIAEEEVEGNKNNKRRRPSEKDRDKEDEEDKEDLPESKKVKKSPEKNKTRKRGRPSGKDRDKEDKEDIPESKKVKKAPRKRINLKKKTKKTKKNVYSVRRSTFGKLSGRMWVKRNPIYYRSQSAGVAMLVSRTTW